MLDYFIKKQGQSFLYKIINFAHHSGFEYMRSSLQDAPWIGMAIFVEIIVPSYDALFGYIKSLHNVGHLPAALE